jgi:alkaline phosphatase D
VLHLGDFVYEVVQYPTRSRTAMTTTVRITFPIKYPKGKVVAKNRFWVPDSLEDYRVLYHAYLQDPDCRMRARRWPFVAMWDNHEFSWQGWQSIQQFPGTEGWVPAQTLKVAANRRGSNTSRRGAAAGSKLDTFNAPQVVDVL